MPDAMRRLIHTETLPIRWGDMDAMGHVNNTVYFRYMEQARITLFDRLGLNDRGPQLPPDCGPVVVHTECTYKRALTYPGDVEVRVYLTALGRSSVTLAYEMRPSYAPAELYAEGTSKGCWIDMTKQKSIALPGAVRALADAPTLA
jgi:acyl-CoA thioester hydrolase